MLERRERLKLEDGRELRLLSALEVLEARREAEGLARGEAEAALCANACLLARALQRFGALPTEERAKQMKARDYLWCALHLALDREEELARLCPACRSEAAEERCPACGALRTETAAGQNAAFDEARFERLKRGESG